MKEVERESMGYRMKFARDQARLGQEQLALELGVSKRSLISWEKNERTPKDSIVQQVATITATDVNWILNGDIPHDSVATDVEGERMFLKDLLKSQALNVELLLENKLLREELNSGGAEKKAKARGENRS